MRIAITTPTGHIGSELTRNLLEKGGHQVTLLCRDPGKVKQLTERGAKAVKCDLVQGSDVVTATANADAVFFLCPPNNSAPDLRAWQNKIGDNFAEAVRKNKIKRVVFLSSMGAQHADGTGPIAGLHDIEEKLNKACREINGNVTHLRASYFMENWLQNIESIRSQGAVYMPVKPEAKLPMIATTDIAKVAADVISDERWSGTSVRELRGPREYSHAESVKIISEAIGKPVQFQEVPGDQARQSLTGMGMSPSVAGSYVQMYEGVSKGLVRPETPSKPQDTTPTTLEQFARQQIAPAIKG
jgi:uncharacterized protein YbjT (DUF2867 family)